MLCVSDIIQFKSYGLVCELKLETYKVHKDRKMSLISQAILLYYLSNRVHVDFFLKEFYK